MKQVCPEVRRRPPKRLNIINRRLPQTGETDFAPGLSRLDGTLASKMNSACSRGALAVHVRSNPINGQNDTAVCQIAAKPELPVVDRVLVRLVPPGEGPAL